jgi:hypothetical protein
VDIERLGATLGDAAAGQFGDGRRDRFARRLRADGEILMARHFRHQPAIAARTVDARHADDFGIDALVGSDAGDQADLVVEIADHRRPALQQRERHFAAADEERLEILLGQFGDDAFVFGDDRRRSGAAIDRRNLAERFAGGDAGDGDLVLAIEVMHHARAALDDEIDGHAGVVAGEQHFAGIDPPKRAARLEMAALILGQAAQNPDAGHGQFYTGP